MLVELYSWYPPIGSMCTTLSMLLHAPTVHTLLSKHWLWCKTKEDFFFFCFCLYRQTCKCHAASVKLRTDGQSGKVVMLLELGTEMLLWEIESWAICAFFHMFNQRGSLC